MKDKKRRLRTVEDAVGAKMGRLIPWFPDRGEPEPEAGPGDVILKVVYEDEKNEDDFPKATEPAEPNHQSPAEAEKERKAG